MISTGELRKGVVIELDGDLWQILDYHHIKMGRGSAQVRIKLRNVKKGSTVEKSFQAGERWPRAQIDRRPVQFLYRDGDDFHFMETETYEQFSLRAETLDDAIGFLKDGMTVDRTTLPGRDDRHRAAGDRRPPASPRRSPASPATPPRARARTRPWRPASSSQVPLFVNEGDTIRIDTRTGEYQTRALAGGRRADAGTGVSPSRAAGLAAARPGTRCPTTRTSRAAAPAGAGRHVRRSACGSVVRGQPRDPRARPRRRRPARPVGRGRGRAGHGVDRRATPTSRSRTSAPSSSACGSATTASRSPFQPQTGLRVVAHGRIDVFEPQGALQLYVESLQPAGFGDLALRFEQLKAAARRGGPVRRGAEAAAARRSRGRSPWSRRRPGAVWHDMCTVLARRWPMTRVVLVACQVQGDGGAGIDRDRVPAARALDRRARRPGARRTRRPP